MSKYSDIIERLETADGPSRELDAQITASLNSAVLKPYPQTDDYGPKAKWQFWSVDGAHFLGNENKFAVEPVTGSLDAAIALVERLLPGCSWHVVSDGDGINRANINTDKSILDEPDYANRAIALLIALFRALDAQEPA